MYWDYLILLSIVQGITEFLPVSSSAHLTLIQHFSPLEQNVDIDLSLHIGSLIALITYLIRKSRFSEKTMRHGDYAFLTKKSGFTLITISAIPTLFLAYFFLNNDLMGSIRENIQLLAWLNLFFAIVLLIADFRRKTTHKIIKNTDVLTLAIFQCLSLFPGVSRSGICITISRFIGFGRKESSIIALVMSLPIMLSSFIYLIFKIFGGASFDLTISILISVLLSFIASYLSIIIIVEFIERIKIYPYVVYRIFLSLLILLFVN